LLAFETVLNLVRSVGTMIGPALAHDAYEALAPTYDAITVDTDDAQNARIVAALARENGVSGGRLLDVACGTGRSFEPMAAQGYEVSGCDISPGMVRHAARRLARAGGRGRVEVADMRALASWRRFDLITCLMDAVNYLIDLDELDAAFASVARSLRPGGLYVFDVTSLSSYGALSANPSILDAHDVRFHRQGRTSPGPFPNALCSWRESVLFGDRHVAIHVQRHWPIQLIRQRLERAGLRCVEVRGMTKGAVMHAEPDEARHRKVVFVARRDSINRRSGKGGAMRWTW
jgi:SAM-dependent methyltransferase